MYESLVKEIARILLTDIAPIELGYTNGVTRSGPGWSFTLSAVGPVVNCSITVSAAPADAKPSDIQPVTPQPGA